MEMGYKIPWNALTSIIMLFKYVSVLMKKNAKVSGFIQADAATIKVNSIIGSIKPRQ